MGDTYGLGVNDEPWGELSARCVRPFYGQLMGTNALEATPSVLAEVATFVDTVRADQVVHLLRSGWREQVVGAWLSVAHQYDESVILAVSNALETSQGGRTAPALLTALVVLETPTAAASITRYYEADVANNWGAAGLARAAAARLPRSTIPKASAADTETFLALLVIANCLKPATDQASAIGDM